jgi:hypothetical protein
MHVGVAPKVGNADAVLNEAFRTLISFSLQPEWRTAFTPPDEPQEAANFADQWLVDYLERWSAYIEISQGGNRDAATSVVCSMLRDAEATTSGDAETYARLLPMARWMEERLAQIRSAAQLPQHLVS